MSIPPPGAPLSHEDATAQNGSRPADDNVQYELKSVQALRGRASSAKAKWHNQGWELVSENPGTLRTELNFRRAKPKTIGAHLMGIVGTFRRMQPKTLFVLVASCAVIVVASIIGIVVGTQSGGDTPKPSAAQKTTASTAPPAEPTVTATTVDELLDDVEPSETSKPSERRAKAHARARPRAQARARVERRGRVFTNCDAARAAGAAPLERGTKDYEANSGLDRDGDGVACES